ncbi:WbqC family protein [Rhizobium leguminosarum]|uniref:WbqC family protein n=1 Tax=Rhizobium leguminosarum TaxID=384 RepID=UPI000DE4D59A|nr:hypothetical protein EHI43_25370 [Rhizobium leguminosarum]
MMLTVVIHQPDFAPYLGFFQRFLNADLYVALDHVSFVYGSRGWTHRDKIKTAQGAKWINVGIQKPDYGAPINAVRMAEDRAWVDRNLSLLRENYRGCAGWSEVFPRIEQLMHVRFDLMSDFNLHFLNGILEILHVDIPTVRSSTLQPKGNKNELLIELLQKVEATCYLSGLGARDYMQPELFEAAGIRVIWQNFVHPVYPQPFGEFIPYLSILDTLLNCGIAGTRDLLWSCK